MRIGFWREFAIGVAIAVIARGSMLFPLNYSQDTYRFLNYPEGADFALFACEMRGFAYPLIQFLETIGAQYPYAGALWPILFSAAWVFAGLVSMRIWLPAAGSPAYLVGAILVALFPYQSDYLSFHNAAPGFSFKILLGWSALYFCKANRSSIVLTLLALTYCVSTQVLFGFFFLVVFFEALAWGFRKCASEDSLGGGLWTSARPWATRMGILFLSAILYFVINKSLLVVTGVAPSTRLELSSLAEYPGKGVLYLKNCYFFLFKGEVSIPLVVKWFQLSLIGLVALGGGIAIFKKRRFVSTRLFFWGILLASLVLAVGACMGVMLPMKDAYSLMNPRTLSPLSIYWTGVFALAWAVMQGRLRGIVTLLGGLLAFSYAVNANRQSVDFARINERDRLVANRMVERLSLLDSSNEIRTVVLVGDNHKFNTDRISTETAGFNISSLYRPWSSTAVLREVSGIPFAYPSDADRKLAEKAAEGRPEWPAPGSAFIEGDVGVVVLPQREN